MPDIALRPFAWGDVPAITAIYRHYVETSTATFDLEPPGPTYIAEKFGHMLEAGHPVVIAEREGELIGYAYASTYRPRPAYRFTCEDSIYLRPDVTRAGLGRILLAELIAQSQAVGFKQMIAVITAESAGSIALHEKFGFQHIGRHQALGLKFDRWLDIVHMQKAL
ncbi:MAG TPA: GNAT family N-acetyltransferase [Devosia sp.]|nr:GNAT family N-acetyltransferase [Devosia sp.]